jgi:hypothetical protein
MLHESDENVDRCPRNEKNRLPCVEADIGASPERFNDQEDDCRNDDKVGYADMCLFPTPKQRVMSRMSGMTRI